MNIFEYSVLNFGSKWIEWNLAYIPGKFNLFSVEGILVFDKALAKCIRYSEFNPFDLYFELNQSDRSSDSKEYFMLSDIHNPSLMLRIHEDSVKLIALWDLSIIHFKESSSSSKFLITTLCVTESKQISSPLINQFIFTKDPKFHPIQKDDR